MFKGLMGRKHVVEAGDDAEVWPITITQHGFVMGIASSKAMGDIGATQGFALGLVVKGLGNLVEIAPTRIGTAFGDGIGDGCDGFMDRHNSLSHLRIKALGFSMKSGAPINFNHAATVQHGANWHFHFVAATHGLVQGCGFVGPLNVQNDFCRSQDFGKRKCEARFT